MLMALPLLVNGVWVNAHMTNEHHDPHELAQVHLVLDHVAHHDDVEHNVADHDSSSSHATIQHVQDVQNVGHELDHIQDQDQEQDHDQDHDPASHVHLCYMALLNVERIFSPPPLSNPASYSPMLVGRVFSPPVPPPNS
jgi:hypothetical protein